MKIQSARILALKSIALSVALLLPTSGFGQVVSNIPQGSFGGVEGLPPGVSVEAHKALFEQMDLLAGEPRATLPVLQTLAGLHASNKGDTPASVASRVLFSAVLSGEGRDAVYSRMKTAGLPEMTATRLAGIAERWTRAASSDPRLAQTLAELRAQVTRVDAAEAPALIRAQGTRDMIPFDGFGPGTRPDGAKANSSASTARYAFPTSVSKVVGELDVLAAKDPQAAVAKADAILNDPAAEPRIEIRLHALRTLAKLGEGREKLVEHTVKMSAASKEHFYIKREAAKLGAVDNRPALIDALKSMYTDANASVRLMAGASLRNLGVDPGPEIEPKAPRPAPAMAPQTTTTSKRPGPGSQSRSSFFKPLLFIGAMLAAVWLMSGVGQQHRAAPAEPPAITHTVPSGSDAPSISAAPSADQKPASPEAEAAKAAHADQQQLIDEVRKNREATELLANDVHQVVEKQKQAEQHSASSAMWNLLLSLAFPIIMIVIMIKLMSGRAGAQGVMNQLSQIKFSMEKPTVTFNDVAGVDESKSEIQEIVEFLQNPAPFQRQGARVPKGVIMYGPPGTGKTMLAKAVANAANANFIAIKGSDFIEMFVGVGAARMRALFQYAREHGPCIIFIDEFDAVAKERGAKGAMNSHDERDQTINAFLAEMDGFDNSTGVLVIAATNRLDILDEAVTRPGRFDRKVEVTRPNVLGREAIMAVHGKDKRLGPDVDLKFIATRTPGHSGADLANVMNEGAILTVRAGKDYQSMDELNEAVDKGNMGVRKDAYITPADKKRLAVHEAGHVAARKGTGGKVSKVTIIGRGNAGGFAEGTHDEDKFLYTETELKAQIAMLMGSSAAEKGKLGELSTGAENDLERANDMARMMVRLGMSDDPELGFYRPRPTPGGFGQSDASPEMAARIDRAVGKILAEGFATAKKAIEGYGASFEALVDKLIESETLSGDQVDEILKK
jgi:cell division protease FtsH